MPGSISQIMGKNSMLFAAFIMICLIPKAALSLTFNDGGIHDIDYRIDESVFVYNNVNPPYNPTTVNLIVGGFLTYLNAADDSIFDISGRSANSLSATDDTILNMTGGYVGSSSLYLEDNSKMYFHGGGVDGFFIILKRIRLF